MSGRPTESSASKAAASASPEEGAPAAGATSLSTHLSPAGEVHMVDVAKKPKTERRAVATATVRMHPETAQKIAQKDAPKGEVLATARIAGIMAAKRTPELIPLCHGIALTRVAVDIEVDVPGARVIITATAEAYDRTGVEMEAMVAASVAGLAIYDMLKGIDREMVVSEVKLLEKSGGRSGHFRRGEPRS
jgi:cyclic pyranopterin phosphate synthase